MRTLKRRSYGRDSRKQGAASKPTRQLGKQERNKRLAPNDTLLYRTLHASTPRNSSTRIMTTKDPRQLHQHVPHVAKCLSKFVSSINNTSKVSRSKGRSYKYGLGAFFESSGPSLLSNWRIEPLCHWNWTGKLYLCSGPHGTMSTCILLLYVRWNGFSLGWLSSHNNRRRIYCSPFQWCLILSALHSVLSTPSHSSSILRPCLARATWAKPARPARAAANHSRHSHPFQEVVVAAFLASFPSLVALVRLPSTTWVENNSCD